LFLKHDRLPGKSRGLLSPRLKVRFLPRGHE
jgi:hypothetical protein